MSLAFCEISVKPISPTPPFPIGLVIISTTNDLLDIGPQQNRMLKLRRITPLDITEGWVSLDDTILDQGIQTEEVLLLTETVEISSTEGEGAEVLFDGV